jgi:ArsR family transcriptional regulator
MPLPRHEAKAELFRTLSHPIRIRVLELLAEGERPVYELLANMHTEPSALSQQLAVLRRAGLVRQRRDSGEVLYSLLIPAIGDVLATARVALGELLADQAQLRADLDAEASASSATRE